MSEMNKGFVLVGAFCTAIFGLLVWLTIVDLERETAILLGDSLLYVISGSLIIVTLRGLFQVGCRFVSGMSNPKGATRWNVTLKSLDDLEEGFITLLLVSMVFLVVVEVIMRFTLDAGRIWIQEFTLHLNAWLVLFGASYGVKIGSHIGVDAVVRLLSPPTRRLVSIFAVGLCLVYCGLFGYGAWIYLQKIWSIGLGMEDTRIPVFVAEYIPVWLGEVMKMPVEELHEGIAANLDPMFLEAPQWPLYIGHSILLIGMILLGIRFCEVAWALIKGDITDLHMADEAREALENLEKERQAEAAAGQGSH